MFLWYREKEERRLERLMNPKGSVTVNINMSELFSPYDGTEEEDDALYYDGKYLIFVGVVVLHAWNGQNDLSYYF